MGDRKVMSIFTKIANLFKRDNDDDSGDIDTATHTPAQVERPLSTDPMNPVQLFPDDECTDAEKSGLPAIQALLNKILMSKYADAFWDARGDAIDCNPYGLNGAQILAKLRDPINLTVNYYNDTALGDEVVDGFEEEDEPTTVHLHREAIIEYDFSIQDVCSLILHERSHCPTGSFYHNGNAREGNENTIPYLCNAMIDDWRDS
jgi:hypothetical protein